MSWRAASVMLPVSAPSHCALMRPAAERLAERLAAIAKQSPTIPGINNVDAIAALEPAALRAALARQPYSPGGWVAITGTKASAPCPCFWAWATQARHRPRVSSPPT